MTTEQIGPKICLIISCGNCKHRVLDSCNKLIIKLNYDQLNYTPDVNCPYIIENLEVYFKKELIRLKDTKRSTIEQLLKKILPNHWEFKYDDDDSFRVLINDLYLDAILELKELFPNYGIEISVYDSETIQIQFYKKVYKIST